MAMPIQSSYRVAAADDGTVRYVHSFFRPGETTDYSDVRTHEAQLDPSQLAILMLRCPLCERQPAPDPMFLSMLTQNKERMLNNKAESVEREWTAKTK